MAATIYLHWSATPYTWVRSGVYHTIVAGDGHLHRLHSYTMDLNAHTWRRNSNAVAISCACMGGNPDPWTIPPTEAQLEAMCQEVAAVARSWNWRADEITIQRVMTHAEAAANRDGRLMHYNYGPVAWGGSGERWDFMQLRKDGPADGGEQLRRRIRALLDPAPPAPTQCFCRQLDEGPHRFLLPSGDHEIFGCFLLQHQPLHLYIIAPMAPIAQRIDVSYKEELIEASGNARQATSGLVGDGRFAPAAALVVQQDSIAGNHPVDFPVVHRDPVGTELLLALRLIPGILHPLSSRNSHR